MCVESLQRDELPINWGTKSIARIGFAAGSVPVRGPLQSRDCNACASSSSPPSSARLLLSPAAVKRLRKLPPLLMPPTPVRLTLRVLRTPARLPPPIRALPQRCNPRPQGQVYRHRFDGRLEEGVRSQGRAPSFYFCVVCSPPNRFPEARGSNNAKRPRSRQDRGLCDFLKPKITSPAANAFHRQSAGSRPAVFQTRALRSGERVHG